MGAEAADPAAGKNTATPRVSNFIHVSNCMHVCACAARPSIVSYAEMVRAMGIKEGG